MAYRKSYAKYRKSYAKSLSIVLFKKFVVTKIFDFAST